METKIGRQVLVDGITARVKQEASTGRWSRGLFACAQNVRGFRAQDRVCIYGKVAKAQAMWFILNTADSVTVSVATIELRMSCPLVHSG